MMARTPKQQAALRKAQAVSAVKRRNNRDVNISGQVKHYNTFGPPKGFKAPSVDTVSIPKSGVKSDYGWRN
jgi:hypothetical protein